MTNSDGVVALVLAAGFGRRFGGDKRLADLRGDTLLGTTLRQLQIALPDLWVILRESDSAQALGIPGGVQVLRTPRAEEGMGSTLADGVRSLSQHPAHALLVCLGDMPWIQPDTLKLLVARAAEETIVQPWCQERPGHPVVFGRRFWPDLIELQGDQGARAIVRRHQAAYQRLDVDDLGIHQDVDNYVDLSQGSYRQT